MIVPVISDFLAYALTTKTEEVLYRGLPKKTYQNYGITEKNEF